MPTYKNPGIVEFDGTIKRTDGGGSYVDFPYDVLELFGVKGRVPMVATFDGIEYRGSLVNMGGGCHMVLLLKEIRERIGKDEDDSVHVTVRLDESPRAVELAQDVAATLAANPAAKAAFDKLAYSHQREYVQWIEGAKKEETRKTRIAKMVEMLLSA